MTRRELVEAGAGCGKTYSLVSRYVEALGLDPETLETLKGKPSYLPAEITALTFTEDAAQEMRERVLKRLEKADVSEGLRADVLMRSPIGTLHSFFLRCLRPHLARLGYVQDVLLPAEVAQWKRKRLLQKALSQNTDLALKLQRVLRLPEILNLGSDLWFSDGGEAQKRESALEALAQKHEEFRQRCLADCARLRPQAFPWVLAFEKILQDPSSENLAQLNFRSRKGQAENPELVEAAKAYRLFGQESGPASLSVAALREEHEAQEWLFELVRLAKELGPKLLDFAAIEAECLALARAGVTLCPPPKLLMVDEFQDTNAAQFEILRAICDDKTEWYFVGDPKQSIYRFRRADVGLFLSLRAQADAYGLTLLNLDTNYRSERSLLESMNDIQSKLFAHPSSFDPPAQILRPKKDNTLSGSSPVELTWLPPNGKPWDVCVEDILRRQQELGKDATHAVLFRGWAKLFTFAAKLRERGVPYRIAGAEAWLHHLLTPVFCSFLEFCANPQYASGALALLRWRESERGEWSIKPLPDTAALYKSWSLRPDFSWGEALQAFTRLMLPHRFERGGEWVAALERWLASLQEGELGREFTLPTLASYIRRQAESLRDLDLPELERPGSEEAAITLMTIHGSKGLQFSVVYLPDLYETAKSSYQSALDGDDGAAVPLRFPTPEGGERKSIYFRVRAQEDKLQAEAEQKRLFYVAFTRAEKALHFYAHAPKEGSEAKPFALGVLGLKRPERSPWNDILAAALQDTLPTQVKQRIVEVAPAATAETVKPPVLWLWPGGLKSFPEEFPFLRMGVSRYLEERGTHPPPAWEPRVVATRAVSTPSLEARLSKGRRFHKLVELWNGEEAHLKELLAEITDKRERERLEAAVRAVAKLAPLENYWACVREKPGQVRREFGVFLYSPDYRLSGVADALWFRSNEELVIIDWKSTSRLTQLRDEERLNGYREQLRLYAEAFRSQFTKIQGLLVGVELSERPQAQIVWDGSL